MCPRFAMERLRTGKHAGRSVYWPPVTPATTPRLDAAPVPASLASPDSLPEPGGRHVVEAALKQRADERFARAIESTGAKDPRDFYRDRLRDLRARDANAYARAVDHYENRLLPAVAEEGSDPLAEWLEYGRVLAQL